MKDAPNPVSLRIPTATIVKVILAILLFYAAYVLLDLLLVILVAIVLATAIEPAAKWIMKLGVPRLLSVIVISLTLAFIFAGLFYVFVPPILNETSGLLASLPEQLESLNLWGSMDSGTLGGLVGEISGDFSLKEFISELRNFVGDFPGGSLVQTLFAIFGGVFSFILIIVLSFYLAVQDKGIEDFLKIVTPVSQHDYILNLWERSQKKIGLWMQGQMLLAVIIGVLVYLGLTILGVRYAFLLAFLAAVFEIIPLFGPVLSAIPAVLISFTDGGLTLALIVVGLYVVIQQFENQLIYPLVVRKVVGLPAILVIIAIIIGAQLGGFLGLILSVPIAAVAKEYVDDVQKKKMAAGQELR